MGIRMPCAFKVKNLRDLKRVGVTVSEDLGDPMETGTVTQVSDCVLTSDQRRTCWDQLESFFPGWVHLHKLQAPRKRNSKKPRILCQTKNASLLSVAVSSVASGQAFAGSSDQVPSLGCTLEDSALCCTHLNDW